MDVLVSNVGVFLAAKNILSACTSFADPVEFRVASRASNTPGVSGLDGRAGLPDHGARPTPLRPEHQRLVCHRKTIAEGWQWLNDDAILNRVPDQLAFEATCTSMELVACSATPTAITDLPPKSPSNRQGNEGPLTPRCLPHKS